MNGISRFTDENLVPISRAYVVYDTSTGDVLHIHHSVTFPHSKHGAETPEARAARLGGAKASAAGVLEVDPAEVRRGEQIKIDLTNLSILRTEAKP